MIVTRAQPARSDGLASFRLLFSSRTSLSRALELQRRLAAMPAAVGQALRRSAQAPRHGGVAYQPDLAHAARCAPETSTKARCVACGGDVSRKDVSRVDSDSARSTLRRRLGAPATARHAGDDPAHDSSARAGFAGAGLSGKDGYSYYHVPPSSCQRASWAAANAEGRLVKLSVLRPAHLALVLSTPAWHSEEYCECVSERPACPVQYVCPWLTGWLA